MNFKEPVELDDMIEYLQHLWTHEALIKHFHTMVQLLRKLPYYAPDYKRRLQQAFRKQHNRINDRLLRQYQERLSQVHDFDALQNIQNELQDNQVTANFSEEQQLVLAELLEYNRGRIRDQYLGAIYENINARESREALSAYWLKIKGELFSNRPYIGKEYESLVAEFIDQKMARSKG